MARYGELRHKKWFIWRDRDYRATSCDLRCVFRDFGGIHSSSILGLDESAVRTVATISVLVLVRIERPIIVFSPECNATGSAAKYVSRVGSCECRTNFWASPDRSLGDFGPALRNGLKFWRLQRSAICQFNCEFWCERSSGCLYPNDPIHPIGSGLSCICLDREQQYISSARAA